MNIPELKFDANGLVPAIAQDCKTKDVLMLAYMNAESLKLTLETGKVHYFSRSRKSLWMKGETSGNYQIVKDIRYDCDKDTLLLVVSQEGEGKACHTGNRTCFFENLDGTSAEDKKAEADESVLTELYETVMHRRACPKEGSYTNYLFNKGIDKILKKVGEENAETIIAAKNNDQSEITCETADLLYHLTVMLADRGVSWTDVFQELIKRGGSK